MVACVFNDVELRVAGELVELMPVLIVELVARCSVARPHTARRPSVPTVPAAA